MNETSANRLSDIVVRKIDGKNYNFLFLLLVFYIWYNVGTGTAQTIGFRHKRALTYYNPIMRKNFQISYGGSNLMDPVLEPL